MALNEYGKLRNAIRHYELAEQSFERSRDEMREAVRAYLKSKTRQHGDSVGFAKRLGISTTQLSNLKNGYAIPSAEWAQNAMKVCGDA
jgi:hypothetical protein